MRRPAGAPLDQLRPSHAQEQQRGTGREQRRRLDQVEERLVAPLDVVEDARPAAPAPRAACGTPRRSRPPLVPTSDSPRSERIAAAAAGSDGSAASCFDHLDHRPVGDPLAVGQAAAAHDPRLDRGERLRHQPRLADAGVADDRHQLAALLALAPAPTPRRSARAPARGRRTATRGFAPARPAPRRAGTPAPAPTSPSARAARPAPRPPPRGRARASPRRSAPRPAPPPARSRAATLTASPVTSRSAVPVTTSPVFTPIRPLDPELRQRVPHLHRRPARPQRVVLVHDRHAEHRHHRVADELLHRAAVRLDDRLHPLEVAGQQRPQRLRIRLTPRARSTRSRRRTAP